MWSVNRAPKGNWTVFVILQVTTDIRQRCTDGHTGTSVSAPIVAGIIALALEAKSVKFFFFFFCHHHIRDYFQLWTNRQTNMRDKTCRISNESLCLMWLWCDYVFVFCSFLLTWRDVQHLLVRTSRPVHLKADDWRTNAAGHRGTLHSSPNTNIVHWLFYTWNTLNYEHVLLFELIK